MRLTTMVPGRRSRMARARRRGARATRRLPRRTATYAAAALGALAGLAAFLKRRGRSQEGVSEGPQVHTTPKEGHPAGTGERTDREIGGPTSPKS